MGIFAPWKLASVRNEGSSNHSPDLDIWDESHVPRVWCHFTILSALSPVSAPRLGCGSENPRFLLSGRMLGEIGHLSEKDWSGTWGEGEAEPDTGTRSVYFPPVGPWWGESDCLPGLIFVVLISPQTSSFRWEEWCSVQPIKGAEADFFIACVRQRLRFTQ